MKAWREAFGASALLFVAALVACVEREWHAPNPVTIVGLYLGGIGLGTLVARRLFVARSEPFDYHGVLSTYAASARTLVFAAAAGLVAGALGSYAVVLVLDSWTSLELASVVGSTWIAALPLVPIFVRAGRTLATWRSELTSPDYRTALVSLDDAERVLLSGSAARDERIGAALVLAALGARERIARARHSFVDPAMRTALDHVVDDTIDDSAVAHLPT